MKVSRRELTLLILLLAVGACYLLYTFLFSPLLSRITASNVAFIQSQAELASYQSTVAKYDLDALQREQQARMESIEETAKPLLPYIDDSEITTFIDQLAQTQSIRVYKVLFTGRELYDTAGTSDTTAALTYPLQQTAQAFRLAEQGDSQAAPTGAETSAPAEGAPPKIENITTVVSRKTVEIQFSGVTYPQLLGFIKQLEAAGRAVYLSNISIGEAPEAGGGLQATLSYGFMQADKLTDADKGLIEVAGVQGAGMTDPFGNTTIEVPTQP